MSKKKKAVCCSCGKEISDTYADGMLHVCNDVCGCKYLGDLFEQIRKGRGVTYVPQNKEEFEWTKERVDHLIYLRNNNVPAKEIAIELGTEKRVIQNKIYNMRKKCSAKAATNAKQNRDV